MSASTPPLSRSADGSPSSSPARIVRSLVVEAFADSTGFVTALYCRVDSTTLTSSTAAPVLLLDLLPGSTFIRGEAYSFAQLASSDAATRAAQLLEIDLPRSTNAPKSTSLRRTVSGTAGTIARVEQQGEQVVLWPSNGTSVAERKGSETNSLADQADRVGQETQEAVVVVHLRTDLGQLRPPTFANTVTVPVPSCLRNKLHLTLPSSSTVSATSSCPVWDLKVHPSLSNVESAPTSTEPLSTLVKGSFPSTHEVSIRWAAQLPPEAPAPTLVIPRSILDVNWQLDDLGSGRCGIQAKGTIEYPGLHDKHWIEINVGGQIGKDISEKMDEARSFVKIADVEGLGVLGWELKRSIEHDQPNHLREAERDAQTLSSFDHGDSPIQRTPTPRRRYSSSTVSSNRSAATRSHASWKANSLFNTAPPILHDDLDTSLLGDSKATGESLLRQSAPFDDAEPSELDLSFEDHDEQGRAESIAVSNREDGDELAAAVAPETDTSMNPRGRSRLVLRIQVSLAPLLHPKRSGTLPEFSFRATLDFPSSALVTTDHSSSPSKMRLSLPAFSIIDSREESSNISATADSGSGRTSKVSLSTSAPQLREQALAQTAVQSSEDGTARWSTTKSWKDELPQSVDVDVELPFIRTPASTEIAPPPAAVEGAPETRRKRQDSSEPRSPPKRTLSVSAASSTPRETLSLVQIQVTPISPTLSLASPSPSDWRIFYRLVFPSSSVVEFAIPLPPDSRVKVHDAWGTDGRTVEWRDEIVQNGDSEKALRITGQRDIREVLYEERKAGEYIEGAALFPFLRARVGKYKVSVLEAQGKFFDLLLLRSLPLNTLVIS
ncbi:uncharacterized protein JCM15063_004916 [Sporobolomyces koalae]|uniref:uncharacterized protein n=1 Tax=Sporobolomyces koalae TaxID=500713 RepID=UPI00316D5B41